MFTSRIFLGAALLAIAAPPPITVEADSSGRWHLSATAGKASYEAKTFDCSGDVTGTAPVDMSSWGGCVEYDLNAKDRVVAFGGAISTPDRSFAEDRAFDEDDIGYYDGAFGGLQFAHEEERTGFGMGVVHVSGEDNFVGGSMFLRIGHRDGVYFRGEVMPAEPTLGSVGWVRLGLGHGLTSKRQFGWFAGASTAPYHYGDRFEPRFFADLRVPAAGNVDLLLSGQVGDGVDQVQWSFAGGLRWTP